MKSDSFDLNVMAKNIGKQVTLPLLDNAKGKIIALYIDDGDPTYQVAYFHNADRKTCYFTMDEVEIK